MGDVTVTNVDTMFALAGNPGELRDALDAIIERLDTPWPDIRVKGFDVAGWPRAWLRVVETPTGFVESVHLRKVPGAFPIQVFPASLTTYDRTRTFRLTPAEKELWGRFHDAPKLRGVPMLATARRGRFVSYRLGDELQWAPMD
jgi:hypothetical protein